MDPGTLRTWARGVCAALSLVGCGVAELREEVARHPAAEGDDIAQESASQGVTQPSDLVAAYGFDEGSGTTARDASSSGNHGALSGATWAPGYFGTALSFDGVNDQVTVPDSASLDLTNGMTLSAWVKPSVNSGWRTVVLKEQPGELVYSLYASASSAAPAAIVFTGAAEQAVQAASPVSTSAWQYLSTTYDGSVLRLYVNGVLASSRTLSGAMPISGGALRIGGNSIWGEYFKGLIDEVRIYKRALTAAELQAEMSRPVAVAPETGGLVLAYAFDEGTGSVTADASGKGNAGTLAGAGWTAAGKYGGALSFNGVSSFVSAADAASLDLTSGMTLEAWVKPASLSGWRVVLNKEQPGNIVYGLFANTDTPAPAGIVAFTATQTIARGAQPLAVGTWAHLASTFDGQSLKLYVNGNLASSLAASGSLPSSAGLLKLGANSAWGEYFDGVIDEVRVYSRALTQAQVQADLATPIGGIQPPPPPPLDAQPPTAPGTLAVSAVGQSGLSLGWAASTDNVGVTGYRVYRGTSLLGTVTATTYAVSGLSCGTAYTFSVEAFDAAGNTSPKASASTTTQACPTGGAALYLSTSGSDANACTATAPCSTMNRAYRLATAGSVVEMAAGSYGAQTLATDATKTSTDDVVFRPAAGAVVSVADLTVDADHLEIRDIAVAGSISTNTSTDDVTFRNVKNRGFFVEGSSNVSFIGGEVTCGYCTYHPQVSAEYGVNVAPTNILFDGVYFHDWQANAAGQHTECLQIGGGDGITIRNSTFKDCATLTPNNATANLHVSWYGFGPKTRNVLVENNFFYASGNYFSVQLSDFENTVFRHNSFAQMPVVFGGQGGSVDMIGNLIPYAYGLCFTQNSSGVLRFKNNVISGGTCDPSDLNAALGFVNAASDLHLQPTAAAIDRCGATGAPSRDIDGQARPLGAAADCGADEAR